MSTAKNRRQSIPLPKSWAAFADWLIFRNPAHRLQALLILIQATASCPAGTILRSTVMRMALFMSRACYTDGVISCESFSNHRTIIRNNRHRLRSADRTGRRALSRSDGGSAHPLPSAPRSADSRRLRGAFLFTLATSRAGARRYGNNPSSSSRSMIGATRRSVGVSPTGINANCKPPIRRRCGSLRGESFAATACMPRVTANRKLRTAHCTKTVDCRLPTRPCINHSFSQTLTPNPRKGLISCLQNVCLSFFSP